MFHCAKLAYDICLLGMSFLDTALGYIRSSTGEITFEFFKTKKGNNIFYHYKQTSDIATLAARDKDQRELVNLIYAVSPNSSPKPLVQLRMTLVAEEDCVINPSFPKEVHFTGDEGVEELFLTKEVEDPGLVVKAMVGCRSIDYENPMLIDMRQVSGVFFLTQLEPALINKGQGITVRLT
jgi:hypothetical protein